MTHAVCFGAGNGRGPGSAASSGNVIDVTPLQPAESRAEARKEADPRGKEKEGRQVHVRCCFKAVYLWRTGISFWRVHVFSLAGSAG